MKIENGKPFTIKTAHGTATVIVENFSQKIVDEYNRIMVEEAMRLLEEESA